MLSSSSSPSSFGVFVRLEFNGDVLGDADAVAQAQGASVHQGGLDAFESGGFAGVDRGREVVLGQVGEGVLEPGRQEAVLGAGDVEADGAVVAVADGQLGDFLAAVGVAHGGDQLADLDVAAGLGDGIDTGIEARLHGLDGLVQAQALRQVLFGGPAHFTVDNAVVGEVFDEFLGDAEEPVLGLHHGDGVVERLEVADQRAGVGGFAEPLPQGDGVGGRQRVSHGLGKFNDGGRTESAVQVVVKGNLGEALQVEFEVRGSVKNYLSHVPTLGSEAGQHQPVRRRTPATGARPGPSVPPGGGIRPRRRPMRPAARPAGRSRAVPVPGAAAVSPRAAFFCGAWAVRAFGVRGFGVRGLGVRHFGFGREGGGPAGGRGSAPGVAPAVQPGQQVVDHDAEDDGEGDGDAHPEQRVFVDPVAGDDADAGRVGHPRDGGEDVEDDEAAAGVRGGAGDPVHGHASHRDVAGGEDQHGAALVEFIARPVQGAVDLGLAHPAEPFDADVTAQHVRHVVAGNGPEGGRGHDPPHVRLAGRDREGTQGDDQGFARQNRNETVDEAEDRKNRINPPLSRGMENSLIDKFHAGVAPRKVTKSALQCPMTGQGCATFRSG